MADNPRKGVIAVGNPLSFCTKCAKEKWHIAANGRLFCFNCFLTLDDKELDVCHFCDNETTVETVTRLLTLAAVWTCNLHYKECLVNL